MGPCVAFYMAKGGGASLATGGAGKVGIMLGKGLMGSTTKELARRTTKQARYS